MRAESVVNNCNLYLSGFKDVWAHKTVCSTLIGIAKVVSYALGVTTIVALSLRCIYGNIVKIKAQLEDMPAFKADMVYKLSNNQDKTFQDGLVEYLVYKAREIKKEETHEIELFQKGFRLLSFKSQHQFFKEITDDNETLKNALDMIPRDIEELNFSCRWYELRKKINNNTRLFARKLDEFKNLKRLHLDLMNCGYFGPGAARLIKLMTNGGGIVGTSEYQEHHGQDRGYIDAENCHAVTTALFHLREVIRKNNDLKYQIDFKNISINNTGVTQWGLFNESEEENKWGNLMHIYLDQVKAVG